MFFKDFVSVKRQKIKRGASQTYDTPSDGLLLQSCIVALARATTAWGTTAIARWLVATVTLILRGIGFLLGLRQIDGALASLLCLEGSCLSNTTSHELKLRLVNQVLKVHARIEVDVHRLDVVLGKLLYRLRSPRNSARC